MNNNPLYISLYDIYKLNIHQASIFNFHLSIQLQIYNSLQVNSLWLYLYRLVSFELKKKRILKSAIQHVIFILGNKIIQTVSNDLDFVETHVSNISQHGNFLDLFNKLHLF